MKHLDNRIDAACKEHSALFRNKNLAVDILIPAIKSATDKLEELHDMGKIPNTTIPVLEDRLLKEICICGESLNETDPDGARRRQYIQRLIDENMQTDVVQKIITDLYFNTKTLFIGDETNEFPWLSDHRKVVENRDELEELRDSAGKKFRSLEVKLDDLPDTDIQGLRETRRNHLDQRDRFLQKQSKIETQLIGYSRERDQLISERERLLRAKTKGVRIISELQVTQDILNILHGSYKKITNDEVAKVSEYMNGIFLEMIGADPEQGAIIKRAEISKEFDIIVYGPKARTLNPDRDLNGASRRALTLAFILALTLVSEVEAPNVIDTPLGMMSGFVKRSVLRTAIEKSSQLILFLTHDEVSGCEEIIDQGAGVVCTLTNPVHYPRMLVNDPGSSERKILICKCTHRDECQLCQRRIYAENELETTI